MFSFTVITFEKNSHTQQKKDKENHYNKQYPKQGFYIGRSFQIGINKNIFKTKNFVHQSTDTCCQP